MKRKSNRSEVARSTAIQIVDLFASLLREEEQRDAFVEVYAIVFKSLKRFEVRQRRKLNDSHPSSN